MDDDAIDDCLNAEDVVETLRAVIANHLPEAVFTDFLRANRALVTLERDGFLSYAMVYDFGDQAAIDELDFGRRYIAYTCKTAKPGDKLIRANDPLFDRRNDGYWWA